MAANNAPEETPVPEHIEALSEAEKGVLEKLKTLDDQYLAMEKEYEVELAELQSKSAAGTIFSRTSSSTPTLGLLR